MRTVFPKNWSFKSTTYIPLHRDSLSLNLEFSVVSLSSHCCCCRRLLWKQGKIVVWKLRFTSGPSSETRSFKAVKTASLSSLGSLRFTLPLNNALLLFPSILMFFNSYCFLLLLVNVWFFHFIIFFFLFFNEKRKRKNLLMISEDLDPKSKCHAYFLLRNKRFFIFFSELFFFPFWMGYRSIFLLPNLILDPKSIFFTKNFYK